MFCTSGDYHKSLHYLFGSSRPSNPDTFGVIGIKWFVRKSCRHRDNYPVYCHDNGGQRSCGSLSKLDSAIRQGYEASYVTGNGWTASLLDQIVLKDGPLISAQFLRRIGSEVLSSGGKFIRRFIRDKPLWSYEIDRSDGNINRLGWYIGGNIKYNLKFEKDIDWFADTCWSMVYSHNQEGVSLDGVLHRLRASIIAGRRVRVVLNGNVAGEPDSVIVETDGHINAQLLTQISVDQMAYFQSNPYWYWQMISTAGFRHIIRLYLESYNNKNNPEKSTVSAQWYADTRQWRKLLTISESGAVTSGSKEVLSRSLKLGGMLRLVVTFSNNTLIAFTADNVEHFGSEISAQFVRYIGHVQKPDSSDRMFAPEPHWNLILVTTEGRLTSSLWDVKDNRMISTNTLRVTSSWFVI
ncbi:uncharacterized protein [Argopecten irradians]|uniref:uncharacterized protein n=1 Tax=Argopecten irradians TaxID=31199 RepID=UPI003719B528